MPPFGSPGLPPSVRLGLPIGLAAAVFCASPAWADDTLSQLLDPTVTSATKRAQSAREVPATVSVVTEEEIRERGYVDLVDALRDLPGIAFMYNTIPDSGHNRINVRGIPGGERLVMLLNGRRVGYASRPQRDSMFLMRAFPLVLVKRIEVAYGPASALYGADAVSAVINVVTKDGSEAPGVELGVSYGLHDTTSDHVAFGTSFDEDSHLLAMGRLFRTNGDPIDARPDYADRAAIRQSWPGSTQRDMSERNDTQYLSLRHQGLSIDVMRMGADAPTVGAGDDHRYASNHRARWMTSLTSLNMSYDTTFGEVQSTTTLGYEGFWLNPYSNYFWNPHGGEEGAAQTGFIDSFKFGVGRAARFEQTLIRDFSSDFSLIGGLVAEDHNGVPQTTDLPKPMNPDLSINDQGFAPLGIHWLQYQNYGAYAQAQLGFVPRLQSTLGARYDYNSRYGSSINPRVGLVYSLSDSTTLKGMAGTSYLAPAIGEMYLTWGTPGEYMGLPNPNLRPVRTRTYELGVLHDFSPSMTLGATVFHNDLIDLIVDDDDDPPQLVLGKATSGVRFANKGQGHTRGAELRVDGLVGGMRTFSSLSLVSTGTEHEAHPLTSLPDTVGTMWKSGVTFSPLSWLSVSPRLIWSGPRTTTPANARYRGAEIPGAWLLDLGLRAQVMPNLALTVSGTNLLDQAYDANGEYMVFTHGWTIPQPGRRLLLSGTTTF